LKRAAGHVPVLSLLAAVGALVASAITVSADPGPGNPGNHYGQLDNPGNHYGQLDNPGNHYGRDNNPGHHYGWYKHPTPPPQTTPPPIATPPPATNPGASTGGGSGVTVNSRGHVNQDGDSTFGFPNLPVTLPVDQTPQVVLTDAAPEDPLGWLVLIVLPALLAVWAIVFRRVVGKLRRRRNPAPQAVPQPA
jgi:hypothetical protein